MALAILIGLVGYSMAVKVIAICKMLGIKIENMNEQEIKELLNDKRFLKYMR
jgi:hypothetical protein